METHFKVEEDVIIDKRNGEVFDKPGVTLIGESGNAFAVIGKCMTALKEETTIEIAKQFQSEAMSGDYDHVLQTATKYCDIE